jgi:hypothetical protein
LRNKTFPLQTRGMAEAQPCFRPACRTMFSLCEFSFWGAGISPDLLGRRALSGGLGLGQGGVAEPRVSETLNPFTPFSTSKYRTKRPPSISLDGCSGRMRANHIVTWAQRKGAVGDRRSARKGVFLGASYLCAVPPCSPKASHPFLVHAEIAKEAEGAETLFSAISASSLRLCVNQKN